MQRFASVAIVATLLVALCAPAVQAGRSLQQDALSNSNGCLNTIPKCESGACATRNIMGNARWVCLRCLANYEPVIDASGQDNIIQCVCPRGFFENSTSATSCTRCPANTFCPGGDKVDNPTTRGNPVGCGTDLVTRNDGARSQGDCVAPAGYAQTSPNAATACGRSEYAPMYNRLARCLRCQSGLEEPLNSGLVPADRANKKAVCKIPPGKYMSQGLVRICPQGFYRENYVNFDDALGTICLPCNPGITTDGAGAGLASLCNKVIPGFGLSSVNTTGATTVPTVPTVTVPSTGLPNATLCDIGYYSLNGYCAQCPWGTTTTNKGAKSIEECMVPPGYFVSGSTMPQCTNGNYREGWLMYNDQKATACTACATDGTIGSEPRDLDVHPLAASGSLVRGTSSSCFIESGFGMIAQGKNAFVAKECPINTYGAAGKVYGLTSAPCKPCPRNMITDGAVRVNNSDVCINPDGFGYASEGASRCAPGFYSLKASRKPCQQCPIGRTTADDTTQQRLITDCMVKAGFGVVNSTANSTDAFNPDLTGLDNTTLAVLPVLECPIGYYSGGNSNGAKCTRCPAGTSTSEAGATSAAQCTVCLAGYGKASASDTTCTLCAYGTFQAGGFTTCSLCPSSAFYPPVDGMGAVINSTGTTLYPGSFSQEACVPKQSQLSPEAGQAYFAPGAAVEALFTAAANVASLETCLAACGNGASKACMAQYDVTSQVCKTLALDASAADATNVVQLAYKLPPATLGSASKLAKAKMMSSGYYAFADVDATASAWSAAGSNLGADARTFVKAAAWDTSVSRADCKKKCDNSNVCWGFLFNPASGGSCLYRGGVDALSTRSFFVLPTGDVATYKW